MKFKIPLLSYLIFYSIGLFAQTGPGGVGTNSGNSNLVLWLDANNVNLPNGTTTNNWGDSSGYVHNFNSGNGAIFNTNSINSYPSFSFNDSSNYFELAYENRLNPNTFTIFSVSRVANSGSYKAVLSNRDDPPGSPTRGFILYSRPNNNNWSFWTGRDSGSWQTVEGNINTTGNWASQMMRYNGNTNVKNISINNNNYTTATQTMTLNTSRPFRIGAGRNESNTPNYYFNGNISEIIMFDQLINDAQIIIIQNYVAAKYNFTLSQSDLYNEDNAGAGNYDHEVAGIGRVDASNLHNDSQGTGIVRILNPTNLGNNEFFMWGHDNADLQMNTGLNAPSIIKNRLTRTWRVSETNTSGGAIDVGSIDMRFDLTGITGVSTGNLRLLVDTDNDGNFNDETPISGSVSLGSNIYSFNGISSISNNRRFTIGLAFTTIITNRRITHRVNN
ncbi:hypothetical protein SAMN04489761_1584 [Tenacibaculum sp. MAR_2009_124]|uniref:hypothetical protein n=1 Tax=Tenacibaculum sp. MAR_2009_124 TaxID=1250059 RepID=UPI000894DFD1|nr:hypothetical protein [Tenacibaculum sp. MAR_2009_124]SEB72816.1 hypothetical protein SAMN04489761_1584 [Tenacibaculum sp. MAR_2009_124]